MMATSVHAADAPASPTDVSAVIVTGTRVTGMKAADSAAPIELVGAEALKRTGSPDLVQALAQTVPSLNIQSFGFDTAALTVSAALRGLNPNDTLVLVDGKRRHTTANLAVDAGSPYSGSATTDLSWIPMASIDHVEVLTDGAAAQYGSDAIAGVVNIILKKNASGGSISLTGGQYFGGDGETAAISLNRGFTLGEKGYLNVTLEQKYHNYSQQGGVDVRYFNPATGALLPGLDPVVAAGVQKAPGTPNVNHIIGDPRYTLYNAYFSAGYDLGWAQLYANGNYGQRNSSAFENYRSGARVSGTTSGGTTYYPLPIGFSPKEAFDETDYSITTGLKGVYAGWNWDLSLAYGKDSDKVYSKNTANPLLFGILSAASAVPIVPQIDFYDGSFSNSEFAVTLDLDRAFDVGLASPLNVAVGATKRRDTFGIGPGEPGSYVYGGAAAFSGYLPQDSGNNNRTNYAGYIDLAVDPIKGLHTDLAGRFEHFSDFGDATVGKFTARYDFNPALAIRTTVSTGFRAPTLAEEFYSGTNVGPTTAFVQLPPNSPQAAAAGIKPLKPETSHNYSIGIVAHPIDKLQVTADVYEIDMHNRILGSGAVVGCVGSTSCTTVISQNVLNAIAARGITLNTGDLTYAGINVFVNGANTRTSGIELTANYATDFGDLGHVDWSAAVNYNTTKITKEGKLPTAVQNVSFGQVNIFNVGVESSLTTQTPKAKLILGALWNYGAWSVNLNETIYGPTSSHVINQYNQSVVDAKNGTTGITNIDVTYKLTSSIKVSAGGTNLFDTKPTTVPSFVSGGIPIPIDGSRVANAPVIFSPYGINGGYYYGRVVYSF
jgi:iron complex outermembrane receptor protein